MIIRSCRPEDFESVANLIDAATTADKTRRLRQDAFRADYFSGPGDTPIERAFVAIIEDTIAGFIWWELIDQTLALQGWVHPAWRRRGIGTALLCAVEDFARTRYGGELLIAARTYGDLLDAVKLFENQNYDFVRRFNFMKTSLVGNMYQLEIPSRIKLTTFNEKHLKRLVSTDNTIFAHHFGSHKRTVEEWRHQMMELRPYNPDLWVIAWENDRIVGECLCNASQQGSIKDGWVSIVGVHEAWRGKGLARAVLTEGLRRLQLAGFETVGLHVDSENLPAVKLYQRMGMDIDRVSLHLHKYLTFQ